MNNKTIILLIITLYSIYGSAQNGNSLKDHLISKDPFLNNRMDLIKWKIHELEKTTKNKSLASRTVNKYLLDSSHHYVPSFDQKSWPLVRRSLNFYTNYEFPTENFTYVADSGTLDWKLTYHSTKKYNNSILITEVIIENWNPLTSNLEYTEKYTFTYEPNGNWNTDISYKWNNNTKQWDNYHLYTYTYNSNNLLEETLIYSWDELKKSWILSARNIDAYDPFKQNISSIFSTWNDSSKAWIYAFRDEYIYNVKNYQESHIFSIWDEDKLKWKYDYKTDYRYDNFGNITLLNDYEYNLDSMQWINKYEQFYRYDSNSNSIEYKFREWNNTSNSWKETINEQYVNIYNPNNNLIGIITSSYDNLTQTFIESNIDDFFYSLHDIILKNNATPSNELKVYPNPTNDLLIIENLSSPTQIGLTDLTGKLIFKQEINSEKTTINLNHVNSGIYLLQFKSNHNSYSIKVVKN